jgi:hypothetical protein
MRSESSSDGFPGSAAGLEPQTRPSREVQYREAAILLRQWLKEESDYDERVGAALQKALEDSSARCAEELE